MHTEGIDERLSTDGEATWFVRTECRPCQWLIGLPLALLGIASLLAYKGLKRLSRRPRPLSRERALATAVAPLDEFSFPSGHTLHAVGFTLVLVQHYPESGLLLWPLCAAIALSRVVLGLHYPSDVLAAIGLGWVFADASSRMLP